MYTHNIIICGLHVKDKEELAMEIYVHCLHPPAHDS